ncbi:MAG: FapA family protein [Butyrivibrio sp.]|nr:FapA family protein [Butyrivibrio sp.]
MAAIDNDRTGTSSSYSGLDSFGGNSYEKELALCKELGADVNKLKAMKFNTLQLAEIRKGITDKVDVSKYMDPSLSWTAMEEMRLEMYQGIDMSSYRQQGFDTLQLSQIRQGISSGIDVSVYAQKKYFADQMREIRLGLVKDGGVPVIFYQDPAFDALQMREIRKGLQAGIDISKYAYVSMPYMKMRAIRESAEDGLFFDMTDIERYNAGILRQIHKAYLDKVDISKYIKDRFDEEQLEQVRIALKEQLPIEKYITGDMRGDAIKEIRLGLEDGVDVNQYADAAYGWQQMAEMRTGLEHQIDITPYCKPLYQADQMREIRLGLEAGLDIRRFSSMMYTAKDMRRIRERMMAGDFDADKSVKSAVSGVVVGGRISEEDAFVNMMMAHKDTYIAFEENYMMCFLTLPARMDGRKYTEQVLLKFLEKNKVIFGIDKAAVKKLADDGQPVIRSLVAVGQEVVHGANGHYEYFFNTKVNTEPEIMRDGSADLSKIECLQQVKVGDRIALYHKATRGSDGYDVLGRFIKAVPGREIPILKGTGFMIMNDRVSYVATYTGAISMVDGKVEIKKLMVVQEVRITDKKIKYDGTVFVVKDVYSGSTIEATGDVIVGGHMESSEIIAGGSVIIKGGVTCPIRGGVNAQGDVSAKYFEGATIIGCNISANYFINCKIEAKGMVQTYGRVGMIYGGTINSLYGVETACVGNKTGAKTIINLGVNTTILAKYNNLRKTLGREEEQLATLNKEKDRLKDVGGGDRQIMQWKVKINAAVATKESRLKELREEMRVLEGEISKGNGAQAVITEIAYANTIFVISGVIYRLEADRKTYDKMIFRVDARRENIVVL